MVVTAYFSFTIIQVSAFLKKFPLKFHSIKLLLKKKNQREYCPSMGDTAQSTNLNKGLTSLSKAEGFWGFFGQVLTCPVLTCRQNLNNIHRIFLATISLGSTHLGKAPKTPNNHYNKDRCKCSDAKVASKSTFDKRISASSQIIPFCLAGRCTTPSNLCHAGRHAHGNWDPANQQGWGARYEPGDSAPSP